MDERVTEFRRGQRLESLVVEVKNAGTSPLAYYGDDHEEEEEFEEDAMEEGVEIRDEYEDTGGEEYDEVLDIADGTVASAAHTAVQERSETPGGSTVRVGFEESQTGVEVGTSIEGTTIAAQATPKKGKKPPSRITITYGQVSLMDRLLSKGGSKDASGPKTQLLFLRDFRAFPFTAGDVRASAEDRAQVEQELCRVHGSLFRAWVTLFDPWNLGVIGFPSFMEGCRKSGVVQGDFRKLWKQYDPIAKRIDLQHFDLASWTVLAAYATKVFRLFINVDALLFYGTVFGLFNVESVAVLQYTLFRLFINVDSVAVLQYTVFRLFINVDSVAVLR